jgi:hypothetical protein
MDRRKRLWDKYTEVYSKLEDKLDRSDVLLLRDLVDARARIDVYDAQCRIDSSLWKTGNKKVREN